MHQQGLALLGSKTGIFTVDFYLNGLIKTSSAYKYLQEINSGGPEKSIGDSHAPERFKSTLKLFTPVNFWKMKCCSEQTLRGKVLLSSPV